MGFIFKGRSQNSETQTNEMIVDVLGKEERFELYNVIEFDSDRKRMSVIVRTPENDIILFCKGADTVIFERLMPGQNDIVAATNKQLELFAQDGTSVISVSFLGLRTLCLAYKKLSSDFYDDWSGRYYEAVTQVYSDGNARAKALDQLYNEVETNFVLLGATAIEDKLQEGVPECIKTLASAGIKIWVLTGDKMETAINIGFLCGLLKTADKEDQDVEADSSEMVLIQIKNATCDAELRQQINDALNRFWGDSLPDANIAVTVNSPSTKSSRRASSKREYALIVDGQSLKYALEDEEMKGKLLDLGCRCKAVICCRVSPLQKAKVVEMVKRGKKVMTLAIGDGANDVSMIQVCAYNSLHF
jgi:phospholipid-translocating ATPase